MYFMIICFLLQLHLPCNYANLDGSEESLAYQNARADNACIPVIHDVKELAEYKKSHALVSLATYSQFKKDRRLGAEWYWARQEVADFLIFLDKQYQLEFHKKFIINSAVRTIEKQHALARYNKNAVPTEGDRASLHIRGMAVDIAKRGMTKKELQWMRIKLLFYEDNCFIDATEEDHQAVFHIVVF